MNPKALSHSESLEVIEQLNNGESGREIARQHEVSEGTVRNIIKRYGQTPVDYIQKLSKATGVAAMKFAAMGFDQLTHRLSKGEGVQAAQLMVMSGIAAQRGSELLASNGELPPPDWTNLNQNIDQTLTDTDSPMVQQSIINSVVTSPSVQAD